MTSKIKRLYERFDAWMAYNPPGALTSTGWRLFRYEFKHAAPIRYWIKHIAKRKYYLPIKWKYRKVADYLRYRLINRYHVVKTGLPPGWTDVDSKMLHTCFTMLVDFVEVEKAWHHYVWSDDCKMSWCQKHMPLYDKFIPFRRPDLGLAHLDWEASLDDPSIPVQDQSPQQAQDAREQRELYVWWTKLRPARKELDMPGYSDQGLGDILAPLDDDFDHEAEDYKMYREICNRNAEIGREWDKEDEEMFHRLINIRKSMWT